ncbi:MAG TPA: tRNA (adenosine(37)-N6)-threonylcarbamoyltransferase complex dimerization subunit type 1 TsaB [Thermoanaerobaculia bacterium]
MSVLALDTASPRPAVAIFSNGKLFEEPLPSDRRASEDLLPAVARVLAAAGLALRDCERIGVCAGPGSFTGLRVGLATAWGFGRALGIPVEPVSTLAAMAEAARPTGARRVVAVLDAGRGDLVGERFDLAPARALSLEPAALLRADAVSAFAAGDPVHALPEDLVVASAARLSPSLAATLARAMARSPGPDSGANAPLAVYSRPSAAEEKHGAA